LEIGSESGYAHWQFTFVLKNKASLNAVKKFFPKTGHYELTRSSNVDAYVWKDETSAGERFEFGSKPMRRNNKADWEEVRTSAIKGALSEIPADIYIRCYNSLRRIAADNLKPIGIDKSVFVLWGPTATGKSHRAWAAFPNAYSKDPRTKWWSGYDGHEDVIIDDFRSDWWSLTEMLSLLDRYEKRVETKGGFRQLRAKKIVITSLCHPMDSYQWSQKETSSQLSRRIDEVICVGVGQEVVGQEVGVILNPTFKINWDEELTPWGKHD